MTESSFDDHFFASNQIDKHDTEEKASSNPNQPEHRSLKRFPEEDFLGKAPEDDGPLYPDLTKPKPEPDAPTRPFAWIVDIFLYPFNRAGSLTLAFILGLSLLSALMALGSVQLIAVTPLLIFVAVPLGIGAFLVLALMILYYVWYLVECMRDSSEGAVRAPDTSGLTPDLADLFGHFVQVAVCVLTFVGLYLSSTSTFSLSALWERTVGIVLALIFPMTLLEVVTTESLRALNPITNVQFICKTSLTYLPLSAGLYVAHRLLFWACHHFLPHDGWLSTGRLVFVFVEIYGLLISAHVLGRFAWRKRETLFWE